MRALVVSRDFWGIFREDFGISFGIWIHFKRTSRRIGQRWRATRAALVAGMAGESAPRRTLFRSAMKEAILARKR
jgi:hypothetical protein